MENAQRMRETIMPRGGIEWANRGLLDVFQPLKDRCVDVFLTEGLRHGNVAMNRVAKLLRLVTIHVSRTNKSSNRADHTAELAWNAVGELVLEVVRAKIAFRVLATHDTILAALEERRI